MGIGKGIRIVLWFDGKMESLYGLTVLCLGAAVAILARLQDITIALDAVQRMEEKGKTMVRLTQSLQHWLLENHKDKIVLIMFGHTELLTDEMMTEYIEWCKTDEGRSYLKGGCNYKED
jgi:hypothetical protein